MLLYNKDIFKRCFDSKGRYWFRNIKYIPLYFKQIHYLIKNGYDEYAVWETFNWFIDTLKDVLIKYKKSRCGNPIIIDNYPFDSFGGEESEKLIEENNKEWDNILDKMIELLNLMDECNSKYDTKEYICDSRKKYKEMDEAKEEFFKLFSKYFWNLWD